MSIASSTEQALHDFLEDWEKLNNEGPSEQLGLYCSLANNDDTRPDVVKHLLRSGADANYRYFGNTALFGICSRSKLLMPKNSNDMVAIVDMLIEHGADVHARSSPLDGSRMPLYSALGYGDECGPARIIQALLAAGADPLAEELGCIPSDGSPVYPGSPGCSDSSPAPCRRFTCWCHLPAASSSASAVYDYWHFHYPHPDRIGSYADHGDIDETGSDVYCEPLYYYYADIDDNERFARARQLGSPLRRITSAIKMVKDFPINDFGAPMPGVPDDVRGAIEKAAAWPGSVRCNWIVACIQMGLMADAENSDSSLTKRACLC